MAMGCILIMTPSVLAKDKPIKLIINNWAPATHHYFKKTYVPWAKEVEEKTNGRVKVEIYNGGTLGKLTTTIEDVAAGKYQVTINIPSYQYKRHIMPIIAELPFAFPSVDVGYRTLKKLTEKYSDIIDEEFSEVEVMGFSVTDPYMLFSRSPIHNMEDLKGKLISLKAKSFKPVIEEWGATPVSIATPEAYTALQRGTIDILTYCPSGALGYKFYEVAPFAVDVNLWRFVICFIMDKHWLNSLPEDLQKLFKEDLNPRIAELNAYNDYGADVEDNKKKIKENSKEVVSFTPAEMEKLRKTAKPAWDFWLANAKKQGLPADQIMEDFKKLLAEEGGHKLPF